MTTTTTKKCLGELDLAEIAEAISAGGKYIETGTDYCARRGRYYAGQEVQMPSGDYYFTAIGIKKRFFTKFTEESVDEDHSNDPEENEAYQDYCDSCNRQGEDAPTLDEYRHVNN